MTEETEEIMIEETTEEIEEMIEGIVTGGIVEVAEEEVEVAEEDKKLRFTAGNPDESGVTGNK